MNAIAQASAGAVSGSKLDNRRVLAGLIDVAIVAVGAVVIMAAAGTLGESPSEMGGGITLVTLGWALYYYFACESGNGQTVGKRVMNLRVVGTNGSKAGMREIGIRTVLRVVDGLFFYLVGLIVMMATGERRGRLGDLAGGTMIVSADSPAAPAPAPIAAEPVSRVPIAESGAAFAPVAAEEAVVAEEPAEVAEPASDEPEVASPALESLAADVSAVTSDPDRVVEEEPESEPVAEEAVEEEPVAEEPVAEEPVAEEPVEDESAEDSEDDEPVAAEVEDDEEPEGSVRTVETVSAMDIVMGDDDRS